MSKLDFYKTDMKSLLAVPIPMKTRTYVPISNEQLINLTLESIEASGFQLESEIYTSCRDGNVANGKFKISNVKDKDMQLQIGWQNSYDKSLSLKFGIGTNVFICGNGMVTGDHGTFKKKHMGEIETFTPKTIVEYIKHSSDVFETMCREKEEMKEIEIDSKIRAELIGKLFLEQDFVESTQMNIIKREIAKPTYDYKAKNSMWELYQFVTYSMKETHPSLYMKNHINAHNFFKEAAMITV